MVPLGLQNLSIIGRFFVLCPYFGESFKRDSTVVVVNTKPIFNLYT